MMATRLGDDQCCAAEHLSAIPKLPGHDAYFLCRGCDAVPLEHCRDRVQENRPGLGKLFSNDDQLGVEDVHQYRRGTAAGAMRAGGQRLSRRGSYGPW